MSRIATLTLERSASRATLRAALQLSLLAFVVACDGAGTEPAPGLVVASVIVSPDQQAFVVGDQKSYSARVLDAAGGEIPGRTVAWTTTNPDVATVSNGGLVTAVGAGSTFIRATVDGKVGSGAVDVAPVPVASVRVDPAELSVVEGDTRALVVVAKDAAGRVLDGRVVAWSTGNASVATVNAAGMLTALASGITTIRATIEGKIAESQVTVTLAPVDRVELSQPALTIEEGESRVILAVVRDAAGRALEGRAVTWSSSDAGVLEVDAAGRVTATGVGRANVTVTVQGRTATAVVTVNRAAVAWIAITPAPIVLEIGESRQMQVVTRDARGNVLQGRAVQWSVDNGNAVISPAGMVTGVRNGYVTIRSVSEGVTAAVGGTIVDAGSYDYDLVYYRQDLAGQAELFVLPLGAGAAPVRLNAGTVSRTPTPSPDGSRIAFAVSMTELGSGARIDDIYAVDRTGLNMRRVTTSPDIEDQPAWSPAGGRIAYHRWVPEGRSDIWIMLPDGSGQVNLTADMPATGFRRSPAWTRDGSRIAFAQFESGANGTTASIWTMRADGSEKRQLTSTVSGFDAMPTYSPDGSRVAFVRYYGTDADIVIVDINLGALTRIALPGSQSSPSWSPDGALIAFTQDAAGSTNIFTMRPNGSQVRLRTVDPVWGGGLAPAWISKP